MNYRSAGVDIAKGDRVVARIKELLGSEGARIGHFGGMTPLPMQGYKRPLLVSSIDSVGTKGSVAIETGKYRGIGGDMVHHSVNDIACCGAEPLAFMDYIAMGSLDEAVVGELLGGVIEACRALNVPLVGGETAEMPGVYREREFDLVGSISGVVEADAVIDGHAIVAGDLLVGLDSNGLHTNGYSLARRVFKDAGIKMDAVMPELGGTVGDALLKVHTCYLEAIRILRESYRVKGLAHITGGGLEGNTRRIIPIGLTARFDWGSWDEPAIFGVIRSLGGVPEDDMRSTFNLGVGLVAVLNPTDADKLIVDERLAGHRPKIIGKVASVK